MPGSISRAGDTRNMYDDTGMYRWYIGGAELRFYWSASSADAELVWFRASQGQAGVDHHLEIKVKPDLDCLLNRWKPAHTVLVYDFAASLGNDPMAGTP